MSTSDARVQRHIANFAHDLRQSDGQEPDWLARLREDCMVRLGQTGFPTTHVEEWRFTDVTPVVEMPLHPAQLDEGVIPTTEELAHHTIHPCGAARLVFINGYYVPELSDNRHVATMRATNLREILQQDSAPLADFLAQSPSGEANGFACFNTAFFKDGAFIHMPSGTMVDAPICILYVFTSRGTGVTVHPRNLIVLGEDCRLSVVEHYVSFVQEQYLTNAVTEIVAGAGARLEHTRLQNEGVRACHVGSVYLRSDALSEITLNNIAVGAGWSRTEVHVLLDGPGAECQLNGLYVADGNRLVDQHTFVDHARPHCTSRQLYKGVLNESARGVFRGRIRVREHAQKTDAHQTNRNLLLSDEATVDTMPQLEILADDVKCTHGATVGQLEDDALFYLRSRGIDEPLARCILTRAFIDEVIIRIGSDRVQEYIAACVHGLP